MYVLRYAILVVEFKEKTKDYLTTIPVVVGVQTKSEILKLKTCTLYHENLLLQKFNDTVTQVLKIFYPASDILEASEANRIPLYKDCRFKSYYC